MIAVGSAAQDIAVPLSSAIRDQLDSLRAHIERAFRGTALQSQQVAFRCLADISFLVPATEEIVNALFNVRQACHAYLTDLEQGRPSAQGRRSALIAIDLLEAVIARGRGARGRLARL